MNEIQTAIEGYNKEKFYIATELIPKYHGGIYSTYKEARVMCANRLKQIDTNIERLLSLEHYPINN